MKRIIVIFVFLGISNMLFSHMTFGEKKSNVFYEEQFEEVGLPIDNFTYTETNEFVFADILLGEARAKSTYSNIKLYKFEDVEGARNYFQVNQQSIVKAYEERTAYNRNLNTLKDYADEYSISSIGDEYTEFFYTYHQDHYFVYIYLIVDQKDIAQKEIIYNNIVNTVKNTMIDLDVFRGVILDVKGVPMKNLNLVILKEKNMFFSVTDDQGRFMFTKDQIEIGDEGIFYVTLYNIKNMRGYYKLRYKGGEVITFGKKFKIKDKEDLVLDINVKDILDNPKDYLAYPEAKDMVHYTEIYQNMSDAIDFYVDYMDIEFNDLPINVNVPTLAGYTCYDASTTSIEISARDVPYTLPYKPINVEWHELSHHIMFDQYRRWPNSEGISLHHMGYLNTTTGDSYIEGFAEFMSLVLDNYYGVPRPGILANTGSMELNYKVWNNGGLGEELAVTSVLWDLYDNDQIYKLYDPNAKDDDNISFTIEEIWHILKGYKDTFTDVYTAFVNTYPDKKDEIDRIFISHGFFADTQVGNGVWDAHEVFLDINGNGLYDDGTNKNAQKEYFIDYGARQMTYDIGETIGSAANYERLNPLRRNLENFPGHYIKTDNKSSFFNLEYIFEDYTNLNYECQTVNNDGMIYVLLPPNDYNAIIKVYPKGTDKNNALIINSLNYIDAIETQKLEYFLEYNEFDESIQEIVDSLIDVKVDQIADWEVVPYWENKQLIADEIRKETVSIDIEFLRSIDKEKKSDFDIKYILIGFLAFFITTGLTVMIILKKKERKKLYS